ncbi:DUF5343 domain-containing protein [Mariniblastus fucicola]|uniref:DUF5343 domain-containing protein n=1 Tax=Mariniblastus fucicola TaxID=980251 RepID=UPI0021BBC510|nr:DUF5343 domain-containing protein [Mariniblastus fucicola]
MFSTQSNFKTPSKKRTPKKPTKKKATAHTAPPKFPYTKVPNALRKFLKQVPERPKPPKVNNDLLAAWELGGSNSNSIIRVLKEIGLLDSSNQPTEIYDAFMQPNVGPAVLGEQVKTTYAKFFASTHEPYNDDVELKRLFNIHSGGSDSTLRDQIHTFKVLCEFATFDGVPSTESDSGQPAVAELNAQSRTANNSSATSTAAMHIDLHIHLPENKTTREYEAIIQDIARYIYRHEDLRDGQ